MPRLPSLLVSEQSKAQPGCTGKVGLLGSIDVSTLSNQSPYVLLARKVMLAIVVVFFLVFIIIIITIISLKLPTREVPQQIRGFPIFLYG